MNGRWKKKRGDAQRNSEKCDIVQSCDRRDSNKTAKRKRHDSSDLSKRRHKGCGLKEEFGTTRHS